MKILITTVLAIIFFSFIPAISGTFPADEVEVLDKDSVLVNGKIPFTTIRSEIEKVLGKPDSIIRPRYDCGGYMEGDKGMGDIVQVLYYGRSTFVAYKKLADIQVLDFSVGSFFLKTPQLILDGTTTLEVLKEHYPQAVKKSYDITNPETLISETIVRIPPKPGYDDEWVLKFVGGKLLSVEYWIGC